MTRARAIWLAATVAVLAAAAYLLLLRRRQPAVVTPAPVPRAVPQPVVVPAAPEPAAPEPPAPLPVSAEPSAPVRAAGAGEQPLATWARVAIIAVALLAFFAVSLIVTKGV